MSVRDLDMRRLEKMNRFHEAYGVSTDSDLFCFIQWCEQQAAKEVMMSNERANMLPVTVADIGETALERLYDTVGPEVMAALLPRIYFPFMKWGMQEVSTVMPSTPDYFTGLLTELEKYYETGVRSDRHYRELHKIHDRMQERVFGWGAWLYMVDGFLYAHGPLNRQQFDDVFGSVYLSRIEALKFAYCQANNYEYRILMDIAPLMRLQPHMQEIYEQTKQKVTALVRYALQEYLLGRLKFQADLAFRRDALSEALREGQNKLFDV